MLNTVKKKIILVDDLNFHLLSTKERLKNNYEVYTAQSSEILFELLGKISPALILLDINMPDEDGFTVMQKLKKDPARLEILGDGKQEKPYMHVDDLVGGIIQFMNTPQLGMSIYNIGVETATTVTRIADMVCAAMGLKGVEYNYTGGRGGWPGDVPKFSYDLSKIHAAGWNARYTSDEAVTVAAEALCKQ